MYRTFDHNYYSVDNGQPHIDTIRCNPKFFGRPRFDTVLVQTSTGPQPARIHLCFEVCIFNVAWQLARISYFTTLPLTALDRAVGMHRYEEEQLGEFIVLDSIIRSCYMSPIPADDRHFYLNDLIAADVDLFLRIQCIT